MQKQQQQQQQQKQTKPKFNFLDPHLIVQLISSYLKCIWRRYLLVGAILAVHCSLHI